MGFLDNIGKGITDFGQATIQKGKDVANVAKYNRMISEEERTIARLFEALGKQYFEMHAQDPEEAFADLIGQIVQSGQKIEEYTEMIKELQGITKCAGCGSDVPSGAAFCPDCGIRVIRKAEQDSSEQAASEKPKKQYCTSCGAVLAPGYKFCAACGAKVEPLEEVTEDAGEIIFPEYKQAEEKCDEPECAEPEKVPEEDSEQ